MSEMATDILRFMPPENVRTYKGLVSGMAYFTSDNRRFNTGMPCFSSELVHAPRKGRHLFVDDVQQIDFAETMCDGLPQLLTCQIF